MVRIAAVGAALGPVGRTHARNSIESLNAQVKAGGREDLESSKRRKVRGFAAGQIIVTIVLANSNLRKIAASISDKIKDDAKKNATGEPAIATGRTRPRGQHTRIPDNPQCAVA